MKELHSFCVGNHLFDLDITHELLSEKELVSYAPFRAVGCSKDGLVKEEKLLFTLTVLPEIDKVLRKSTRIASFDDENGRMSLFATEDGGLSIVMLKTNEDKGQSVSTSVIGASSNNSQDSSNILISSDYRNAYLQLGSDKKMFRYALDTALMLLYAFASAQNDTLLLHASVVEYEGKGYLFLGKSGTGKSTHSRLWMENIEGARLLNDDNPVVRIIDGKPFVFGSPWSGKTPCYINRKIPVEAVVRLHQAPFNRITPLSSVKAYATILPSCSLMKWNHKMASDVHKTISRLIQNIGVYNMECLPDKEAALLCFHTVNNSKHY